MQARNLDVFIQLLKRTSDPTKFHDLLLQLRDHFTPWISFTLRMLPFVNARISGLEARRSNSEMTQQSREHVERELQRWQDIRNIGVWLEQELPTLNERLLTAADVIATSHRILPTNDQIALFHYLEDLHGRIHQADLHIRQLLQEYKAHVVTLYDQMTEIKEVQDNLVRLEDELRRIR